MVCLFKEGIHLNQEIEMAVVPRGEACAANSPQCSQSVDIGGWTVLPAVFPRLQGGVPQFSDGDRVTTAADAPRG